MPIFRSEPNQSLARKVRLQKARLTQAQVEEGSRRVRRVRAVDWGTRPTFSQIDCAKGGAISAAIRELVVKNPGRKINILDWGCWDGTAAKELARNKSLNVFGFSIDSAEAWMNPEGVTFLQTSSAALPIYLRRKKIKLDVVYENASLKHTKGQHINILRNLSPVLNIGAKVFTDPLYIEPRHINSLESAGFAVEVERNFLVSLTKMR